MIYDLKNTDVLVNKVQTILFVHDPGELNCNAKGVLDEYRGEAIQAVHEFVDLNNTMLYALKNAFNSSFGEYNYNELKLLKAHMDITLELL